VGGGTVALIIKSNFVLLFFFLCNLIGMGVPSTLRGTIRELLTRACVGETWDPEKTCGPFASPHWISSLGFPARPPAPLCAVAVDGAPWNAGDDGWILGGFSEAAFAAVCFTRRGVAEEEDLKLNAVSSCCFSWLPASWQAVDVHIQLDVQTLTLCRHPNLFPPSGGWNNGAKTGKNPIPRSAEFALESFCR
jgi:hypothetical protein